MKTLHQDLPDNLPLRRRLRYALLAGLVCVVALFVWEITIQRSTVTAHSQRIRALEEEFVRSSDGSYREPMLSSVEGGGDTLTRVPTVPASSGTRLDTSLEGKQRVTVLRKVRRDWHSSPRRLDSSDVRPGSASTVTAR